MFDQYEKMYRTYGAVKLLQNLVYKADAPMGHERKSIMNAFEKDQIPI